MAVPAAGTYPPYFERYLLRVEADSIAEAIEKYSNYIIGFFRSIPAEKIEYSYAPGKWSIKEMLQHIIDTERIFGYRALRIARNDKTPLPGFNEESFAKNSNASERNWRNMLEEFTAVRTSTDLLLQSFSPEQLERSGTTNDHPNTTNAICFMIFGHILHHIHIVQERYLQPF